MRMRSIADIERFMHKYPEFKKQQGMVAKHVALTSHLSAEVDERNLLDLSELEQELACEESLTDSTNRVETLMADPKVRCLFYPFHQAPSAPSTLRTLRTLSTKHPQHQAPLSSSSALLLARGAGREEARRRDVLTGSDTIAAETHDSTKTHDRDTIETR
jgi:hypothetical protein